MTTCINLTLQDRASPVIEQLIFIHDHTLIILLIIMRYLLYMTPCRLQIIYRRFGGITASIFMVVRKEHGITIEIYFRNS